MIAHPLWDRCPACHRSTPRPAQEGPACQDRRGSREHIDPALTSRALLAKRFSTPIAAILLLLLPLLPLHAAEPQLTITSPQTGTLPADYTTSKLFLDEIAAESIPLDIIFTPADPKTTEVQIWTNLNRRDRAVLDADGDGYHDAISPPDANRIEAGDDSHYFKAHPMDRQPDGTWRLRLNAEKTGAYRLSARWKIPGDPHWHWFTDLHRKIRDHAITVTPREARDIRIYEINVLNIEASGDTFATRSTIEDMHNAPGAPHNENDRWNLDYLRQLGSNWLWFQPIHPTADEGREPSGGWDTDTPPYEPGSPYAVKNFFEVNPVFCVKNTRPDAMAAWQAFSRDADKKGVGLMLDAPFNHTAYDVELGEPGVRLFQPDGETWKPSDLIRDRIPQFFSNSKNYGTRANSPSDIAPGPDRADFGKWRDVADVFFGRYDALVENPAADELMTHRNEGDWLDLSGAEWNSKDFTQDGKPRNITRLVWQYFAEYTIHWLEKTRPPGQNRNSATESGLTESERRTWDAAGIDGLRCDFGQGLPPQAWEYITNAIRNHKWNFVMMSESLDGGPVTFRSNRHFDVLNESIVFPLKSADTAEKYRAHLEERRQQFGPALVLLNTTSHDEENYDDPWQALVRYAAVSASDGIPMIFPGQELGITKTWGYDHYERNFGKTIPHFKRYNSMAPAWNDQDFTNDQLFQVYAAINRAREKSPALRSPHREFLKTGNDRLFGIAKWSEGANPVLAFINLDTEKKQTATIHLTPELLKKLGLRDDARYQARNLASRDQALWATSLTGKQLREEGLRIELNPLPRTPALWQTAPYEPLYLEIEEHPATP